MGDGHARTDTGNGGHHTFSYLRAAIAGLGYFSVSVVWAIFNQFVPLILQAGRPGFERELLVPGSQPPIAGFGLPASVALFIMTWDNIINVFFQPWIGARSDRTWNRFGRRKPWVLSGLPIVLVGFMAIPFARSVPAIIFFILATNVGMAFFRSPTAAWLGDLFNPKDRSKANGTINIMGGLGGILALFLAGALFNRYGIGAPFVAGAVLVLGAVAIITIGVREPPRLHVRPVAGDTWTVLRRAVRRLDRNAILVLVTILFYSTAYYGIEAGLSSFVVFSLGISPGATSIYGGIGMAVFLLFALPAGLLGTRYSRRRMVHGGLAGLAFVFLLSYVVIRNGTTLLIMLILFSALWSLVSVNGLPLLYDHGDERYIGAFTGFYYFCSQLAAVIGPTGGGLLVDWLDNEYRFLFIFSSLFFALAWLVIGRVRPRLAS